MQNAHLKQDLVNQAILDGYDFLPSSATLADVEVLANAQKVVFNAHLIESGVHVNNDVTNTISVANATDQASANLLLNELKISFNRHVADGPSVPRVKILGLLQTD